MIFFYFLKNIPSPKKKNKEIKLKTVLFEWSDGNIYEIVKR